jgi:hypothetical protein
MFKEIPCPHMDQKFHSTLELLPNFHPLTKEEIRELLEEAKGKEGQIIIQIFQRLVQGIKGMTCPQPLEGPLSEKVEKLSSIYLQSYKGGADEKKVEEIFYVLNG